MLLLCGIIEVVTAVFGAVVLGTRETAVGSASSKYQRLGCAFDTFLRAQLKLDVSNDPLEM